MPELLIAMTILSFIMTLCYTVMHSAGLQVKRSSADTQTQKQTMLTLQKMVGEATYSDHRSLTVTPTALSYLSPHAADPGTAASVGIDQFIAVDAYTDTTWQKFLLFYYEADKKRVMLKEFIYSGGQALARLDKEAFPLMTALGSYPARRVADNISDFEARQTGPKTFLLTVASTQQRGGEEQFTNLNLTFTCRNGL